MSQPALPRLGRRDPVLALGLGVAVLVLLRLWQGASYWDYSEGVYALTSQLWLDGADLYGDMAAAQPPGLFVLGAGILGIHDGLGFLRGAVGVLQLGGGLVAAVVVWRLVADRLLAIAACPLVLLTPWAVHEHGFLTPELPAVPLLLGAGLLASRERTAAWAGVLAALAVGLKLPFLLPAMGLVLCAADRRRCGLAALGTLALAVLGGLALFGSGLWRDVVVAQLHCGSVSPHYYAQLLAQEGWSLGGLVVAAGAALVVARRELRDPALVRAWTGLAAGMLLTALTTYKDGTGLNILVPVEAVLVPPAIAGAALLARRVRLVAVAGVVVTLLQTATLLVAPAATAFPFLYPTSDRGAWGRVLTDGEVQAKARSARACPPGVSYSELPLVAFVAHRPPPGGQPDGFLPIHSSTLARERAAIVADTVRCPAVMPLAP